MALYKLKTQLVGPNFEHEAGEIIDTGAPESPISEADGERLVARRLAVRVDESGEAILPQKLAAKR